MLDTPTFSVIVVSQARAQWLRRCVLSLGQLDYPAFEIVVVANQGGLANLPDVPCKRVLFEVANISKARNAGIAVAAGDFCAFIDDDSVAEPLWLAQHEAALRQTGADASVGYVRGRNGITFQSQVASVDGEAETHQQPAQTDEAFIPILPPDHGLKLVGTNAVVRRSALVKHGGFDPAFAFFLDDTDLSLRLSRAGVCAAVAPLAEVHHAFASSPRRTSLRAPTNLFDIGRSSAIYLRRHHGIERDELFTRMKRRERARLIKHMVRGTCEPSDIAERLRGLQMGWLEGLEVELPALTALEPNPSDFMPVLSLQGQKVFASRLLRRHAAHQKAQGCVKSRVRSSVFSFSLTPVRHHVRYTDQGVWMQTGGQFGRSDRKQPLFKWCRFADRLKSEIRRVEKQRGIQQSIG